MPTMPSFDFDAMFDDALGPVTHFPDPSSLPCNGADSWVAVKRLLSPLFVANNVRQWDGADGDFAKGLVVFRDNNGESPFGLTECGRFVVKSMLLNAMDPERVGAAFEEVLTVLEVPRAFDPSNAPDTPMNGDWLQPAWPVVFDVDSGTEERAYDVVRAAVLVGFAPDTNAALFSQQLPGMHAFDADVAFPDRRVRRSVMRHAVMVVHLLCKAFMVMGCALIQYMIGLQHSDFFELVSAIGPIPFQGVDLHRADARGVFGDPTVRGRMWMGHDRRSRALAKTIALLRHAVRRVSRVYEYRSNRLLCATYRVVSAVTYADPVIEAVVSVWCGGRTVPDVILSKYGAMAAANMFRFRECLRFNVESVSPSGEMRALRSRMIVAILAHVGGDRDPETGYDFFMERMWVHGFGMCIDSDDTDADSDDDDDSSDYVPDN